MDPSIRPAVRKKLEADHNCTPVFLTQEVKPKRWSSLIFVLVILYVVMKMLKGHLAKLS